jgi:hypothetical protein
MSVENGKGEDVAADDTLLVPLGTTVTAVASALSQQSLVPESYMKCVCSLGSDSWIATAFFGPSLCSNKGLRSKDGLLPIQKSVHILKAIYFNSIVSI